MRCASCGCRLTPDELTYLDGRFCEQCTAIHSRPQPREFDPLAGLWQRLRKGTEA